jgi:hypothetical protein
MVKECRQLGNEKCAILQASGILPPACYVLNSRSLRAIFKGFMTSII